MQRALHGKARLPVFVWTQLHLIFRVHFVYFLRASEITARMTNLKQPGAQGGGRTVARLVQASAVDSVRMRSQVAPVRRGPEARHIFTKPPRTRSKVREISARPEQGGTTEGRIFPRGRKPGRDGNPRSRRYSSGSVLL